ncbi:hypothetical protein FRX31_008220 [Thalictrum thalictroides]|uniref:Transmembrane protein n=1 Tax=Thalictrum thalictroides TaxID=46969 RepID=A0A7J6WXN6_THATH|nr:hypothetical protein FRX31_008220 [Thalictrum thalictroides]
MYVFQLKLLVVTLMIVLLLLQNCPANSRSIINSTSVEYKDEVWNFPCQGGNKHGILGCNNNKAASRMKEKPLRSLKENSRVPPAPTRNPPTKRSNP